MKKSNNKTAEILYIKSDQRTTSQYSQPFRDIMRRWESITADLKTAFEEEEMHAKNPQIQTDIEAKYEKAGRDQCDVLEHAASLNAIELADVLAKLELWKIATCPTPESEKLLSLPEQMLLSAYGDLSRFLAFNN